MFNFLQLSTLVPRKNSSNSKRVYLDNAGATNMSARAKRALVLAIDTYGNPSAIYKEGDVAKKELDNVRKKMGDLINARKHEVYFTGTGTESCNLAIFGVYLAWKKENEHSTKLPHIIISSIEHPAVMEVVNYLSINSLANVTYLPVYDSGIVKVQDIRNAITDETVLVSVMYANNEIGTIQPIKEIGRMIEEVKKLKVESRKLENSLCEFSSTEKPSNRKTDQLIYPLFHTDACQAGNYLNLDVFRLKVDMMTINASKLYGPKGIALLYKKEGVKIEPIILGGGQERNIRSGTESLLLASSFAESLKESIELREIESERLTQLRNKFKEKLSEELPQITFYGDFENRLPNNINCRIPGIKSDEMILRLDNRGFSVSHKSACASSVDDSSYVIKALGAIDEEAKENIRITLGRETKWEDLERLIVSIKEIVEKFAK